MPTIQLHEDSYFRNSNTPTGTPDMIETASMLLPKTTPNSARDGEEQALESHEVIELQTFSERKAWIEEKIKVCHDFELAAFYHLMTS